jgi:hypothetical protein
VHTSRTSESPRARIRRQRTMREYPIATLRRRETSRYYRTEKRLDRSTLGTLVWRGAYIVPANSARRLRSPATNECAQREPSQRSRCTGQKNNE